MKNHSKVVIMETSEKNTIEQLNFIWSLILLPSALVLNVTAFLLILKTSGSCYKDPIVPPLLSVIGKILCKPIKSNLTS